MLEVASVLLLMLMFMAYNQFNYLFLRATLQKEKRKEEIIPSPDCSAFCHTQAYPEYKLGI